MLKARRWLSFVCLTTGSALVFGCSDSAAPTYPVSGQVVYSDGTPLPGGVLVLESIDSNQKTSPRGTIGAGGKFQLITPPARQGAEAGKYKVMVQAFDPAYDDEKAPLNQQPPRLIHPRYEKFTSSDLEVEVEPKDNNEVIIRVDRPR